MIKYIFKTVKGIDYAEKVERMSFEQAMWEYGNDKPDIRFGMKILSLRSAFTLGGKLLATGELIAGQVLAFLTMRKRCWLLRCPVAANIPGSRRMS